MSSPVASEPVVGRVLRSPLLLGLFCCAAGLLASCERDGVRSEAQRGVAAEASRAGGEKEQAAPAAGARNLDPRKVIVESSLTVEVPEAGTLGPRIHELVEEAEGYVARSRSRGRAGERGLEFVIRVPSGGHDALLDRIAGLGTVLERSRETEDVTEEWYDLEARLKADEALEASFLELLGRAESTEEILEVRRALSEVRSDIESKKGRLNLLRNRVTFSTIELRLVPPAAEVVPRSERPFGERISGAFDRSLAHLAEFGRSTVLFAVALAPWLPLVLLGAFLVRWVFRELSKHPAPRRSSAPRPRDVPADSHSGDPASSDTTPRDS